MLDTLPFSPLDNPGAFAAAAHRWPRWCEQHPVLSAAPTDFAELHHWSRAQTAELMAEILAAVLELATGDGDEAVAASYVAAWMMWPGALRYGVDALWRVRPAEVRDFRMEVVTALWLAVRSYEPRHDCTPQRAIIRAVTREIHHTYARSHLSVPVAEIPERAGLGATSPADAFLDIVDWGCERNIISSSDMELLCAVAEAQATAPIQPRGMGLSTDVSARVGDIVGISPRSVRRRSTEALAKLAEATSARRAQAA